MYFSPPPCMVSLPSSLFNVIHWALILGSALIAYRLLTVRPPYEETIAENIVKVYYTGTRIPSIPSKEYDKELGQIVNWKCPEEVLPSGSSQFQWNRSNKLNYL